MGRHLTLDLSSGLDLRVVSSSPDLGSTLGMETTLKKKSFLKSHCILSFGATPALPAHNTGCITNFETEIVYTRILPTGVTADRGSLPYESLCYTRRIRELCDPFELTGKTTDIILCH